jgi:hypothetical protein
MLGFQEIIFEMYIVGRKVWVLKMCYNKATMHDKRATDHSKAEFVKSREEDPFLKLKAARA